MDLDRIRVSYDYEDRLFIASKIIDNEENVIPFSVGELVLDFINLDYMHFLRSYGFLSANIKENNQPDEVRKHLKNAIEICFLKDGLKKLREDIPNSAEKLDSLQRYFLYFLSDEPSLNHLLGIQLECDFNLSPNGNFKTEDIMFLGSKELNGPTPKLAEMDIEDLMKFVTKSSFEVEEVFYVKKLEDLLYLDFMKAIQNNLSIKICKNCNTYFFPKGRVDTEYCNKPFDKTGKTCIEIGASRKYAKKIQSNPVLSAFNKEYKKMSGRVRIRKITQTQFYEWSEKARDLRDEALKKDSSPETLDLFRSALEKLEV